MSRLSELIAEHCPDGVEYKALGEVFEKRNGYTPSKKNSSYWEGGIIPWFRMEDIRANGTVLDDAVQHVTDAALKKGGAFPANSFIVATSATIGVHALITCDFLCNQRFTCLSLRKVFADCFDLGFLNHYFVVLDEYCLANVNQGSFASVKMGAFDKFRIPVPPIEVQREVVRILDEYTAAHDELVRQLEEEMCLQAHLQQGMHDEIIEKAIFGNQMISLGNVCQITDGDHQPPPKTELGIPFVTISCIDQRRMIDYSQASFVSDAYYMSLDDSRRPLKGDVLLTVVGTLGVPVRVMDESPFVVQRHIAIMRPSKTVDQGFLYHYVSWSKFHSDAVAAATGSAQKTIGLRYLRKAVFPEIPIDEQILVSTQLDRLEQAFVELKERLTDDIELINQQLALVRNQLLSFPEKVA